MEDDVLKTVLVEGRTLEFVTSQLGAPFQKTNYGSGKNRSANWVYPLTTVESHGGESMMLGISVDFDEKGLISGAGEIGE